MTAKITDYKNISFFGGLNALRFFAAFLVVMHHSETIRAKNNLFNLDWLSLFKNGGNAVSFFFVLSGFLITYLLLKEKRKTGTINVKQFYLRRILRIWPLYFLLVIIGTLLLPIVFRVLHINYIMPYSFGHVWYYFVFFLPGLVTFFFGHHLLEPLWSIGVEEVFYLMWAPLFRFFKKNILCLLISVIVIKVFLQISALYIFKNDLFIFLMDTYRFEAMAVGGLGAYFIYNRRNSLLQSFIFKLPIQIFTYSLLLIFLTFNINIHNPIWNLIFKGTIASPFLLYFLFLYLIIGVSVLNEKSILKFNSRILSYLGEISYGIYMYHMLILFAIIQFFKSHFEEIIEKIEVENMILIRNKD